MAGPWEEYQTAPRAAGPWDAYAPPKAAAPAAPPPRIDTAEGMSGGEKFLVGTGAALARAGEGVLGLAGNVIPAAARKAAEMKSEREAYEAHKGDLGWRAGAGELVGNLAAYAPAALASGGAVPAMLASGALGAAYTPGGLGERAQGAALDAAGAGAGHLLTRSLGRLANPIGEKTADVLALEARGVQPTFGQAMGSKGGALGKAIERVEEAGQSTPLGGSAIRNRRTEALGQFQQAAREGALPPGASTQAAESTDALRTAYQNAYNGTLSAVPMPKEVLKWSPAAEVKALSLGLPITQDQRLAAQTFVRDVQRKHLQAAGKAPTAETAHSIQSEIRRAAAQFGSSQNPGERYYGELLADVAENFGQTWRGALAPDVAEAVQNIDRAYASYVPVRHAAKTNAVSRNPDEITPNVLLRALRTTDRTPNKSTFVAGNRPQQSFARAAEDVLTSAVPDSGTTERALTLAALAGAVPTGGLSLAPSAVAGLYGSRMGQNYLMGRYSQQQALADLLRAQAGRAGYLGATIPNAD